MPKKTYQEWLNNFIWGKKEVPSPVSSDKYAVHSRRRFVDSDGVVWEIAITFTGRLVVRSGKIGADGVTITWAEWITEHDVEMQAVRAPHPPQAPKGGVALPSKSN